MRTQLKPTMIPDLYGSSTKPRRLVETLGSNIAHLSYHGHCFCANGPKPAEAACHECLAQTSPSEFISDAYQANLIRTGLRIATDVTHGSCGGTIDDEDLICAAATVNRDPVGEQVCGTIFAESRIEKEAAIRVRAARNYLQRLNVSELNGAHTALWSTGRGPRLDAPTQFNSHIHDAKAYILGGFGGFGRACIRQKVQTPNILFLTPL
jgi:hypothetical protein